MRSNAIMRIIIWSLVIVLLLGILGSVFFAVNPRRRTESIAATEAALRITYPTEEVQEALVRGDQKVYSSPNEDATVLGTLDSGESIIVDRTETVSGDEWAFVLSPIQGWVILDGGIYLTEGASDDNEPGERVIINAEQVEEIKIEWVSGDILIQTGDVEDVIFREDGVSDSKYAMVWKVSGNTLKISFSGDNTFGFGINTVNNLSKDLTITVPRDWECDTLEIDAASAAVEVNDLTIREVDFDGASGACEFENCTVDEIDLDTASGDIRFIGSLDTLDCDAASASVYAVLSNTPSRMDLDTMSGDLDITLPENAGFTVSNNSLSSNFSSDFETSMKNGNHVCGDGRCRINVDALSGNVTLRKGPAAVAASPDTPSAYPYHTHSEQCLSEPNSCPDTHQHTDSCVDDSSTCPQRIASSHHHTDSCTTDPNSCPDTHTHTDNCSTDPGSCPLGGVTQHQHSDSCTTDPNSCPDTHQHTNSCIDDPDSCPSHETDTHHSIASSGVTSSSSSGSHSSGTHHEEQKEHH